MSIIKKSLPLILVATALGGCSTFEKGDVPLCAAIGGVVGGGLGATESSAVAGWGALGFGVTAAAYCWVHGDEDGDGVTNKNDKCPGTPRGTEVDADGCPVVIEVVEEVAVVEEVDEVIVINNLHFAFDSAEVNPADQAVLNDVAARLKKEAPDAKLAIAGFTDSVGSDAYNLKLSERRAVAVANYLVNAGVAQSSIVAVAGEGEANPVADNATADGRAMNRRVEIAIDR